MNKCVAKTAWRILYSKETGGKRYKYETGNLSLSVLVVILSCYTVSLLECCCVIRSLGFFQRSSIYSWNFKSYLTTGLYVHYLVHQFTQINPRLEKLILPMSQETKTDFCLKFANFDLPWNFKCMQISVVISSGWCFIQ